MKYLPSPTRILIYEKISIRTIYSGYDFCFAKSKKEEIYSWGLNIKG